MKYGALFSPQDNRDYLFRDIMVQNNLPILPKVDLRNIDKPIRDQGNQGSCTGFSSTAARQIALRAHYNQDAVLSPAFTYYMGRQLMDGDVNKDEGCYLRDIMKAWQNYGCCLESDFPYNDAIHNQPPNDIAMMRAERFKIKKYYRAYDMTDIQAALTQSMGVVIAVSSQLIDGITAQTGGIINPYLNHGTYGGHALAVVGYYNHPQYQGGGFLVVKNSWGIWWGNQGYFYMPYGYVFNKDLMSEAWVMED